MWSYGCVIPERFLDYDILSGRKNGVLTVSFSVYLCDAPLTGTCTTMVLLPSDKKHLRRTTSDETSVHRRRSCHSNLDDFVTLGLLYRVRKGAYA